MCGSLNELLSASCFVSLHAPYNNATKHMINTAAIEKMLPGSYLINFARGELVDNRAVADAVRGGRLGGYYSDFPSSELIGIDGIVVTPHIGGRTADASDNCAVTAATQLKDYLETGSIKNAVTYPNIKLDPPEKKRLCLTCRSHPDIFQQIMEMFSRFSIKPGVSQNAVRGDYGYIAVDFDGEDNGGFVEKIENIKGVLKAHVIA